METSPKHVCLMRWAGVIILPAALAIGLAWAYGVFSPHRITPQKFMTALHNSGNPGMGARRAHAKGVCVSGWFDASGALSPYSSAAVFQEQHIPVIGRFALAPGNPLVADTRAEVRSLALRLQPRTGEEWRTGMNDPPLQPMRDVQDAYDFFRSAALDPTTHKPDPARLALFAKTHPWLATALEADAHRTISTGFADDTYNSLDSFILYDAQHHKTAVRWSMVPVLPLHLSPDPGDDQNGLFRDLIATLHEHPLHWQMVMTLANPQDPVNDPSQPWSATDQKIVAGTLTITDAHSEDQGPCTGISFDPTILPAGISLSGDPLPALRSSVYMRSFMQRSGEKRVPAMVTPAMTASPAEGTMP